MERVGNHGWNGPDGGGVFIDAVAMTVHIDDNCNPASGALEFADGELRFPADGMQATDRGCEGVDRYDGGWIFGRWMVELDGSLVVIATRDGTEHQVPEL